MTAPSDDFQVGAATQRQERTRAPAGSMEALDVQEKAGGQGTQRSHVPKFVETEKWTTAQFFLALVLVIIIGVLSGLLYRFGFHVPVRGAPKQFFKKPGKRFQTIDSLYAQAYAGQVLILGQPLLVKFKVLNLAGERVVMADRRDSINGRRDEYSVIVTDSKGKRLKDPAEIHFNPVTKMESKPVEMIALADQMFRSWTLDLNKFAVFEKPGTYTVKISRVPFIDRIRVAADPIEIEVLPGK